eukprot:CAMPEP_0170200924 /NCGR_PEP_ID=MMETSP0040_2-20121228/70116_1 /TAXON_ID=641309 /ORGANISM="Lotharella oceanica, Strain CCMP622" /LENGTH=429 /DNA_ID=CAMNT_0010451119 /DNA_START=52 /DNA_END=1341 /DNA_ORIENTATION=-
MRPWRGTPVGGRSRIRVQSASDTGGEKFSFTEYVSNLFKGQAAQGEAEKKARDAAGPAPSGPEARWNWWFVLPTQPGEYRPTVMSEVVPGQVWSFEQMHGAINILVNMRMTVLKVKDGLLVYSPVAPTGEVMERIKKLESLYGPVRYILLPTQAAEHKVFFGPFARGFPEAEVWACPGQWSWPIPLPLSALGLGLGRRVHVLGQERPRFEDEVDVGVIGPFLVSRREASSLYSNKPGFGEVSIYHRPSRSLLVTDTLVYVEREPPRVCLQDPVGLLFHARDRERDVIENTEEKRLEGWAKITLLALYILPGCLDISNPRESFVWTNWQSSFEATSESLMAAPFLRQLVFRRYQDKIKGWIDKLRQWDIERVIPAHFSIAEDVTTTEVVSAIEEALTGSAACASDESADMKFLVDVDALFEKAGILPEDK